VVPRSRPSHARGLGGRRRRCRRRVLVLEDDWIDQLYVEPGRTGGGIGGKLMAVAKRQRPSALRLWTFETNIRARRFYERHGFVATDSTAGDNEEGAPDVRYEWSPSTAAP
jgi:GNAT superfamily N-acetyltransferase